jgi:hypothetical protein
VDQVLAFMRGGIPEPHYMSGQAISRLTDMSRKPNRACRALRLAWHHLESAAKKWPSESVFNRPFGPPFAGRLFAEVILSRLPAIPTRRRPQAAPVMSSLPNGKPCATC